MTSVSVAGDADGRFDGESTGGNQMIKALLGASLVFLIATFPATWLLMLFMGNVAPGMGLSYWGALPMGIMVSTLLGGVTSRTFI
ncbi:MAG TPA: hypothetical protein VMS14_00330 [Ilumatobacteraceae bacterium]|nr:hypothetical protein [Ilumatobacteraceae bacterium]